MVLAAARPGIQYDRDAVKGGIRSMALDYSADKVAYEVEKEVNILWQSASLENSNQSQVKKF